MWLSSIHITNFRCLASWKIEPCNGINLILGDNGSGKTSALECIHLLGRGHSFRPGSLRSAIGSKSDTFTVRSKVSREARDRLRNIACQVTPQSSVFRLDNNDIASRSELIDAMPLQHLDPDVHRLVEQGPKSRREFLDWGVFHVEQAFFPAWRRYRRALKQRNKALKTRRRKNEFIAWDAELVEQGEIIDACRRRYLSHVARELPVQTKTLLGSEQIELSYRPGWPGDRGFGEALAASLDRDAKLQFTQFGPHRADFTVSISAQKAKDWVSRGQQKILTSALMLAQARILVSLRGIKPVLLIDDMSAELGTRYREILAQEVVRCGSQAFITFLNEASLPTAFRDSKKFYLE